MDSGENRTDMGGHAAGSLEVMAIAPGPARWNEAGEGVVEVEPNLRLGVLSDRRLGRDALAEQGQEPGPGALPGKPFRGPARDRVQAGATCPEARHCGYLAHARMLGEARAGKKGRRMEYDPDLPWRDIRGEGYNAHIGPIRFAPLGENRWCATLVLDARHTNVGGICHGGVLLDLADVAMGASTFISADRRPCATIQLDGHFLAAAKPGQRLVAVATQLRRVRELSFMQCAIWAEGRQVMRASGTWKYLASRGPGAATTGAIV